MPDKISRLNIVMSNLKVGWDNILSIDDEVLYQVVNAHNWVKTVKVFGLEHQVIIGELRKPFWVFTLDLKKEALSFFLFLIFFIHVIINSKEIKEVSWLERALQEDWHQHHE